MIEILAAKSKDLNNESLQIQKQFKKGEISI